MTSAKLREIDSFADSVRTQLEIAEPIRNIEDVVVELGGRVVEADNYNELVDGAIEKCDDGSFMIRVSPAQTEARRRFTIAHELGHLFLHMGYLTNDSLWKKMTTPHFFRNGRSELESQANEFAAALLMPRDMFIDEINKNVNGNTVNMAQVADTFGVSLSAAINRGKFLGCLKW